MIYTSYFARVKNLPNDIIPISICVKAPDGWKGIEYKKLAPKWSFLSVYKQTKDKGYYIENFNKLVLDCLNQNDVIKELYDISDGKDIALICYEKSGDFCHRHLVADWLKSAGIECVEYNFVK